MSVGGIFLLLAFALAVIGIVALPFLRQQRLRIDENTPALVDLRHRQQATIKALRELDFDHQMGKLAGTDYHEQREQLLTEGAALLRQIDTLEAAQLEAAIRARREQRPSA